MKNKLKMIDLISGETRTIFTEAGEEYLSSDNGGCDCNRALIFYNRNEALHNLPCGSNRFLVIEAPTGWDLDNVNSDNDLWMEFCK